MKRITLILIAILLISSIPVSAKVQKEKRLWQDETVYSIMVDRFNDGDTSNDIDTNTKDPLTFNGGDIQGIIDKLDYIQDMGFTAIRLTPIFANAKNGYHGYWVNDFYKVDEHFGTLETFQKLVKEAHQRKIKVILDFVTNNVAATNPLVKDPSKSNWFHPKQEIADWNNREQIENGWVNGLPDLNQDNPEVKKYLIDAAKWWMKKTEVDGFGLPEVNHVPLSFWKDFSKEVKKDKKDFFLQGIPAESTSLDLNKFQSAGIDSLFDYNQSESLRKSFANTNQSLHSVSSNTENSQSAFQNGTFFDNEYTVRFTSDIVDQRQFPGSRWKTALTYLYTTPGIPNVYYGTEIALNGGEIPDNRRQMSFRAEKELIDYITKLGELRNTLPSLTRGTMEMLYNQDGMTVYMRVYQGETSIIAINNTRKSQKVTLTKNQLEGGKELRGLLGGDLVRSHNNQYNLIIDRDESEIYVLTKKSGLNIPHIASLIVVYLLVFLFLILILKRRKRRTN
ncbi:alpha-amylase family glycosyl hydrolase [Neobacillus drentensis]|uniref:alpha-amylase family glycosyl hydrolase n=1 Tax=Neobacillus drentensis TaxID=220684 RepID=UPI0030000E29